MRTGTPIYLNVYDFTTMNSCLSLLGIGGYHTGIEIKDVQFCFCVVDSDEKETGVIAIEPESAEFPFNRKLYLGETYLTDHELQVVIEDLSLKYTCGVYHMFKCNCNHFSDELVDRILGIRLPQWIFRSTNILNYICCCLPKGVLSGQWALQAMRDEMDQNEEMNEELILNDRIAKKT